MKSEKASIVTLSGGGGKNNHSVSGFAINTFTLAEGATHVDTYDKLSKNAFTLAEVLITLGIIGVVAALTIPTLVANYQTKSWNTASSVFEKRLTETLKTMNVQGKLGSYGGYSTTEGFVNELQKHLKIAKVCDNAHLMECFEDKITMNDEEIDMTKVKKAENFGQSEWGTNIVGIQVANGTSALIAYNPKCKSNPYDNTITGSDCVGIVYDTSGFSSPNEMNKDLRKNASVLKIAGKNCAFEINGTCFTQPAKEITPLSLVDCETTGRALGIKGCVDGVDYWGGAVIACGGVDKLPSAQQLADIANELYGTTVDAEGFNSGVTLDTEKAASYGFDVSAGSFMVWSNDETCDTGGYACYRYFAPTMTRWFSIQRSNNYQVLCIGE